MLLIKIFYYLALITAGLFLYVRLYEAKGIFLPSKKTAATPLDVGLSYENISIKTADQVALHAWLIEAPRAHAPTLLFLHGNAGNISHRLDKLALFHKLGFQVLIMDYRGYGQSEGHPTEKGMYLDTQAAYDYLRARPEMIPGRLIVYGESLGSAAAVDLLSRNPAGGLILEGSFSSARDMAKVILPIVPPFFVQVKMDSLAKIGHVDVPKLFIHSRYDEVVPYNLARKLFDAAPAPKRFLEIDGDHNEGYALSYGIYIKGIADFLSENKIMPGGERHE